MPCYEFSCEHCCIYWEKDRPLSESGKGSMCPQCKKKGQRQFGVAHYKMQDGHMIQDLYAGKDKSRACEFYREAEKETAGRLGNRNSPYKRYEPDPEKLVKEKGFKVLNVEEQKEKRKTMEKQTKNAYKRIGQTPGTSTTAKQNL